MRRSVLFVALLAAAVGPLAARGAVRIDIMERGAQLVGTDIVYTFEVFGTDLGGTDERLNAYTIAIDGGRNGAVNGAFFTPNGVRFALPGSTFGTAGRPTQHPYVFKDMETIPPIENFGSTYNRLQFGATTVAQEDEVNVNGTHDGFLKFSVIVPLNTLMLGYTLSVDPRALSLAGLGAPIVATPGPGIVFHSPEPSAAALLLLPSLALLRRRRAAAFN